MSETQKADKYADWWATVFRTTQLCRELKQERDQARRERNAALEELTLARKQLVAANRGAERNAKVNQGLCARLAEAERERDEALEEWDLAREGWSKALEERDERNKAMDALKWIAGRYCHEKTTFQLAQEAYEMSSKARWTLQEIEQKEEA